MAIKIAKLSPPKIKIKTSSAQHVSLSSRVRPKAASAKVTSIKPGTLRITPSNLKTTIKQPSHKIGGLTKTKLPR